jgi:nucleoside 2-deoxyribosyltransferase
MADVVVIMPASSDPQSGEKRKTIQRQAHRSGLSVVFPMDRYDPASDASQALAHSIDAMHSARLVLADLSKQRPSCYYELGVAEAAHAHVVITAETGTDIHQTSHRLDVLFFDSLRQFSEIVQTLFAGLGERTEDSPEAGQ